MLNLSHLITTFSLFFSFFGKIRTFYSFYAILRNHDENNKRWSQHDNSSFRMTRPLSGSNIQQGRCAMETLFYAVCLIVIICLSNGTVLATYKSVRTRGFVLIAVGLAFMPLLLHVRNIVAASRIVG